MVDFGNGTDLARRYHLESTPTWGLFFLAWPMAQLHFTSMGAALNLILAIIHHR